MDRLSASFLLAIFVFAGSAMCRRASETFFETRIRPVLATECLPCHGGKKTENGFKVDSRESLLRGGDRGPAIVAGEPEKSLLIRAIRYTDDELKMPPSATCRPRWRPRSARGSPRGRYGLKGSQKAAGAGGSTRVTGRFSGSRRLSRRPTRPASHRADRSVHRGQAYRGRLATRAAGGPANLITPRHI